MEQVDELVVGRTLGWMEHEQALARVAMTGKKRLRSETVDVLRQPLSCLLVVRPRPSACSAGYMKHKFEPFLADL